MKEEAPRVNLETPLRLGNGHTGYNLMFGKDGYGSSSDEDEVMNGKALGKLLVTHPTILDSLTLIRSFHGRIYVPGQKQPYSYVLREVYEGEFEGSFDVPWLAIASVKEAEVLVDYEARFKRPDFSLEYVLNQSKRPQFLAQPAGDVLYTSYPKVRTRIDGLLTWINIDKWEEEKPADHFDPKPKAFTLKHRNLKPQHFTRRENEYAMLEGTDSFVGKWFERWVLSTEGERKRVDTMEVYLLGSWR